MSTTATKPMTAEQAAQLPPLVVGYERKTFVVTTDRREFVCGVHGYPHLEWPSHDEPVWRGEVPEGAECSQCGIVFAELE